MAGGARPDRPDGCTLHASCVAWHGRGILIHGPAGSGKSDLALRLIEAGAVLVADDLVALQRRGRRLVARPVALSGLIELRGLGIFTLPSLPEAPIELCLLLDPIQGERLPDAAHETILGVPLPATAVAPACASAVMRVRMVLFGTRAA
ncbi:MAG TPA: hypothetical protein VFG43_08045 [Geminicoccaceae bacterium]|nr:hypothetical protein [Geminicoccaceae bacterium]